mmetsp:Transcript_62432/g.111228  ORF Transcript_62432/g.111228 Transcript_62432/m.111228 type:complete len:205 (+) Transcript_62432:1079-1693(+)
MGRGSWVWLRCRARSLGRSLCWWVCGLVLGCGTLRSAVSQGAIMASRPCLRTSGAGRGSSGWDKWRGLSASLLPFGRASRLARTLAASLSVELLVTPSSGPLSRILADRQPGDPASAPSSILGWIECVGVGALGLVGFGLRGSVRSLRSGTGEGLCAGEADGEKLPFAMEWVIFCGPVRPRSAEPRSRRRADGLKTGLDVHLAD